MRARMLTVLSWCLLLTGCVTTAQPRWEIGVTVQVESQLDEKTKAKGGIELKRPIAAVAAKPAPKG